MNLSSKLTFSLLTNLILIVITTLIAKPSNRAMIWIKAIVLFAISSIALAGAHSSGSCCRCCLAMLVTWLLTFLNVANWIPSTIRFFSIKVIDNNFLTSMYSPLWYKLEIPFLGLSQTCNLPFFDSLSYNLICFRSQQMQNSYRSIHHLVTSERIVTYVDISQFLFLFVIEENMLVFKLQWLVKKPSKGCL